MIFKSSDAGVLVFRVLGLGLRFRKSKVNTYRVAYRGFLY